MYTALSINAHTAQDVQQVHPHYHHFPSDSFALQVALLVLV